MHKNSLGKSFKMVILFTVIILLGGLTKEIPFSFGQSKVATVTGSYVNIRSGPGTNYSKIDMVYKGDKLTVETESKDWYRVKLANGKVGWIAGWLVTVQSLPNNTNTKVDWKTFKHLATVTGSTVNLRGGPSTSYSKITTVVKGQQLGVNQKSGDWYNVTLANGTKGWIAGWLINVSNNPGYTTIGNESSSARSITVTGSTVNVRTGPGTNFSIIATVKKDSKYELIEEKGDWYKIRLSQGKDGWIAGWLVQVNEPVNSETPPLEEEMEEILLIGTITGTTVNLRSGPGTTFAIVKQVKKGEEFLVVDEKDGWYRIEYEKGKETWIAGWLVEVKESAKEIRLAFSKGKGIDAFFIYSNLPTTYSQKTEGNIVKITLDSKFQIKGLEDLKLMEPIEGIATKYVGASTQIILTLSSGSLSLVDMSQDKKTLKVILPSKTLAGKKIVLDPGHGGNQPGAVGPTGYMEKDFTLDTSLRLEKILELLGAEVIMIRRGDDRVTLQERATLANQRGGDIFISIHANASENPNVSGTQTFYYAPASVPHLFQQLNQRKRLAEVLQREMLKDLQRKDMGVLQANFSVLRDTKMPSVLLEVVFISNPVEEQLLRLDSFREETAWAIAKGILNFFEE